jgi:hypothetical protein
MALTLAQLLDEVQKALMDVTPDVFTDTLLTRAVSAALQEVNRCLPRLVSDASSLSIAAAGQREVSLSSLGALAVVEVWFPYIAGEYPPRRAQYQLLEDATLWLDVEESPQAGDKLRLFYLAGHTISGLDSASAGTLPRILEELVIEGACAHACAMRAVDAIGEISVSEQTPAQWREEAERRFARWYGRLWKMRRDPKDARSGTWPLDR